ncbi:hypothetical protein ART_0844 [Arthrobacter sp. PAMC 25486]|nr:hypothetical protein ART_0844 [Arthrobacter sp. PAMC 25486]
MPVLWDAALRPVELPGAAVAVGELMVSFGAMRLIYGTRHIMSRVFT